MAQGLIVREKATANSFGRPKFAPKSENKTYDHFTPISGQASAPLEIMPSYIQTIAKVLPLTYFADGLRYSMLYKYPEGAYTNMAIVAVLAVVFLVLGAFVTRWKEK